MLILIPFPSLEPHGGTRVAVEIANGLAERGHSVYFALLNNRTHTDYWAWHPGVRVVTHQSTYAMRPERILVTSPHSIFRAAPGKTVIHLQMLEHLFRPDDIVWRRTCEAAYKYPAPLLSISRWNIDTLALAGYRSPETMRYIGNGVSSRDFPRLSDEGLRELKTVLVEGWVAYNPCKDTDRVAPQVVRRLKEDGYRIVAYGGFPPTDYQDAIDQFHLRPNLGQLNTLYAQASVLVKASRYDARSCSPVEAMAKGCPTARAIVSGDDDLIDDVNALRVDYEDVDGLYLAAKRILEDGDLRARLVARGYQHIDTECVWGRWIDVIEQTLEKAAI